MEVELGAVKTGERNLLLRRQNPTAAGPNVHTPFPISLLLRLQWRPTAFSGNTLVTDIPGNTYVAAKSKSRKGDRIEKIPRALFDRACQLIERETEFPDITSTEEKPSCDGGVFGSPGEMGHVFARVGSG